MNHFIFLFFVFYTFLKNKIPDKSDVFHYASYYTMVHFYLKNAIWHNKMAYIEQILVNLKELRQF